MNDAENLCKLLSRVTPAIFRDFLIAHFHLAMPELDPKQGKRAQRAAMETVLTALPVEGRRRLEDAAERIVLLSDRPGQDVILGVTGEIDGEDVRAALSAISNPYERALWLYRNAPLMFDDAFNSRQADVFRQNQHCYSGFVAPRELAVLDHEEAHQAFHQAAAAHFGCAPDTVAVQIFKRLRPGKRSAEKVEIYQISTHHNQLPEIMEKVEGSELVPQEVVCAITTHITYEPETGHLEVLSKERDGREELARIAADTLLQAPISGERIPLKQYHYQSLAAPRDFDLTGEDVVSVKVVELGYSTPDHRSLLVKIWASDPDDIYTAARSLISLPFDFRHHPLNYAKLSIVLRKQGPGRAPRLSVILRGENGCNVKTQREQDRQLCDRLLAKWGLVRNIDDAEAVHAIAA